MASAIEMSVSRTALAEVIRRIRSRWRLRLVLHGLAVVAGAALISILVAPWLMDRFRFDPAAVIAVRVLTYSALLALAVRYLVLPLRRSASDARVALYLEEHEPSLQEVVVSAVEASATDVPASAQSPHFVARLIESAVSRTQAVGSGDRIEQKSLLTSGLILGGILAVGVFLLAGGASRGAGMLNPLTNPADRPYFITAKPGNAEVTRGGNVALAATLHGFASHDVALVVQRDAAGAWERLPMAIAPSGGAYELRLFDVQVPTSYYVEANGIKSPTYRLQVVDLPYVKTLVHEYHYPAYTDLPVEQVAQGGDIAVLKGTRVRFRATTTMPVKGGRIVLDSKQTIPMTLTNGVLMGEFPVTTSGFYTVELETLKGKFVPGSLEYAIAMLEDAKPVIALRKPGRDARITAVEEVPAEVEAVDDYGIMSVVIKYAVNGGPEQALALHRGRSRKQVLAGYVFSTEEFGLKPGDLVAYYAEATDNSGRGTPVKTDIYFLNVRHFENSYRQGAAGGQGGQPPEGPPGEPPPQFTRRQREIVAATFKTERDRADASVEEFTDNTNTLLLSQGKLRGQLDRAVKQLAQRGGQIPEEIRKVMHTAMSAAVGDMKAAEGALKTTDLPGALAAEQRALLNLQHADAALKEFQRPSPPTAPPPPGQAPPGEPTPPQEDLADLFGLKDQEVRNRAEAQRRQGGGGAAAGRQRVDATLEKLKKLAAKLEAQNERQPKPPAMPRSSGRPAERPSKQGEQAQQQQAAAALRQLAKEAEDLSEQLKKIARDRPTDRALPAAAQQLKQVADALRKAAAQNTDNQELRTKALAQITEARRLLEQSLKQEAPQGAANAMQLAEQIAHDEREIAKALPQLDQAGADRVSRAQALAQRKDQLASQVDQLEGVLDQLGKETAKDNARASRKFSATADFIRASNLKDQIQYSKQLLSDGTIASAANFERMIGRDTEKLPGQVAAALAAMQPGKGTAANTLLDRAADLARQAQSLSDRQQPAPTGPAQGQGQGQGQGKGDPMGERKGDGKGEGAGKGEGKGDGNGEGAGKGEGEGGKDANDGKGQSKGKGKGNGESKGAGSAEGGESKGEQRPTTGKGSAKGHGPTGAFRGRKEAGREPPTVTKELFTRAYKKLTADAQALRKELKQRQVDTQGLDRAIQQMEELAKGGVYSEKAKAEQLSEVVTEQLKAWVFTLRRQVEKASLRPALGGNQDVPSEFQPLVDEYYRSLADRP